MLGIYIANDQMKKNIFSNFDCKIRLTPVNWIQSFEARWNWFSSLRFLSLFHEFSNNRGSLSEKWLGEPNGLLNTSLTVFKNDINIVLLTHRVCVLSVMCSQNLINAINTFRFWLSFILWRSHIENFVLFYRSLRFLIRSEILFITK